MWKGAENLENLEGLTDVVDSAPERERESGGVQSIFGAAGSQSKPIDLDQEDGRVVVDTSTVESDDPIELFAARADTDTHCVPLHEGYCTSTRPIPSSTTTGFHTITTNAHESRKKRLISPTTPSSTPPHKKHRTSISTTKHTHKISPTPILPHLPQGRNYIFIPNTTLPAHATNLPHLKRMLSPWLDPQDVRADETGYFMEFGGGGEGARRAWECAGHFKRKEVVFKGGWELKMVVRRKS
jgi:hypothetical protein